MRQKVEVRTKDNCRRQWRGQSMVNGGMQSEQGGRHVSLSKSFSISLNSPSRSMAIRGGGLVLEAISKLEKVSQLEHRRRITKVGLGGRGQVVRRETYSSRQSYHFWWQQLINGMDNMVCRRMSNWESQLVLVSERLFDAADSVSQSRQQ